MLLRLFELIDLSLPSNVTDPRISQVYAFKVLLKEATALLKPSKFHNCFEDKAGR
jgi:hypothetical protein